MMRSLFLCLLLLLPAATALAQDEEASGDDELDDEEMYQDKVNGNVGRSGSVTEKTSGADETTEHLTLVVIVVAVTVLALSVAAIVAIMLVRRHMHKRRQGIYTVPVEQHQKASV